MMAGSFADDSHRLCTYSYDSHATLLQLFTTLVSAQQYFRLH